MLKPGDVLLYTAPAWKFSNLIPKVIQLITGNKVTHVALYIGVEGEKHIILDALADGVNTKIMSEAELYNRLDDFVLLKVARLSDSHLPIDPTGIVLATSKYVRKKYGFLTILNLFFQHGKTRLFPNKKWTVWFKSNDAYICSQVVQLVYESLGYVFDKDAALVEPDDYLSEPWNIIES